MSEGLPKRRVSFELLEIESPSSSPKREDDDGGETRKMTTGERPFVPFETRLGASEICLNWFGERLATFALMSDAIEDRLVRKNAHLFAKQTIQRVWQRHCQPVCHAPRGRWRSMSVETRRTLRMAPPPTALPVPRFR
jgi:hypothetical protein